VLDDERPEVAAGTLGNIVIKLPLPPGCLPTLWQRRRALPRGLPLDEFPGFYKTADAGFKDEDGYVFIMSAPTTSSTSPATGCRPAAMEEVLAAIRTSPNAP
jgi:propionyl-CoA synthetase